MSLFTSLYRDRLLIPSPSLTHFKLASSPFYTAAALLTAAESATELSLALTGEFTLVIAEYWESSRKWYYRVRVVETSRTFNHISVCAVRVLEYCCYTAAMRRYSPYTLLYTVKACMDMARELLSLLPFRLRKVQVYQLGAIDGAPETPLFVHSNGHT